MMSSIFSQWEDSRQISVSIILMSHDLSQPIIIGYLGQIHTDIIQRDERHYEAPHSVGVWSLKRIRNVFHVIMSSRMKASSVTAAMEVFVVQAILE